MGTKKKKKKLRNKHILTPELRGFLLEMLSTERNKRLKEIQNAIQKHCAVKVSLSTISRFIKKNLLGPVIKTPKKPLSEINTLGGFEFKELEKKNTFLSNRRQKL
jgi:transposase